MGKKKTKWFGLRWKLLNVFIALTYIFSMKNMNEKYNLPSFETGHEVLDYPLNTISFLLIINLLYILISIRNFDF